MTNITTIKISTSTKTRLDKLKIHPKESYEEVLSKILYILNVCRKDPGEAKKILEEINASIKKIFPKG